ncbi:TraR/DksA C4-type zinc finger protein, partial [Serratia sarumanii]|uniref:TraR/DksA C4-type zinc finger protein n=1 Tax=Serratia sarumanii TaxID=3020826 RepID=UPI003F803922
MAGSKRSFNDGQHRRRKRARSHIPTGAVDAVTKKSSLPAAHECDECGEEIPEARRRTVPG